MPANPYDFSADWFSGNIPIWTELFDDLKPDSVLEIGSYEGRSAVWMAETMKTGHITCVDTWEDGGVRDRFNKNKELVQGEFPGIAIVPLAGKSFRVLPMLRASRKSYDFVYVDGSHKACDALSDAIDAFHLCRSGGVMIFDDYYGGRLGDDLLDLPGMAIDAFLGCFRREAKVMGVGYQMMVRKI